MSIISDETSKAKTIEHTPGPWSVNTGNPRQVDRSPGFILALVAADDARGGPKEHANARLIASSPDMLESLVELLSFTKHFIEYVTDNNVGDATQKIISRAETAIARATGQNGGGK